MTFGFRGEALASISTIAHVQVTTATSTSPCAYKAHFHAGRMLGPAQPVAGKKGTTIVVQDLFCTMPARRKTFTKPREDFKDIINVVSAYALHHPAVGFVLKEVRARTSGSEWKGTRGCFCVSACADWGHRTSRRPRQ